MTSDGIPQLHFDQLNVIAHHLHAIKSGEDQWNQKDSIRRTGDDEAYAWPPIYPDSTVPVSHFVKIPNLRIPGAVVYTVVLFG